MTQLDFKGKWVLVTGASSGLGREIARYLARVEKANLIISARRGDRLEALKKEIESTHYTQVQTLISDLAKPNGAQLLYQQATKKADIFAVINNAGITFYGKSDESNLDIFEKIININLNSVIYLSLKFLGDFLKKGEGAILNVTSEGGLIPLTYQTVYSASKHAAQAFTEGLHMEYRKSGITVCSFAPGGIVTEMLTISNLDKKLAPDSFFNMKADVCAKKAIKAFKKKRFISVPGILNKITVFFLRFVPRKLVARITESIYRPID